MDIPDSLSYKNIDENMADSARDDIYAAAEQLERLRPIS